MPCRAPPDSSPCRLRHRGPGRLQQQPDQSAVSLACACWRTPFAHRAAKQTGRHRDPCGVIRATHGSSAASDRKILYHEFSRDHVDRFRLSGL